MKRFLRDISVFLSLAAITYVILIFIWGLLAPKLFKKNLGYVKGGAGHLFSRLEEVKSTKNVDLLFLGSSHTYRGFDNRIFSDAGYSSFNLGSSAQSHLQTQVLLKRYLQQLNPKLVIYEVYPHTFESDGLESSLDLLSNDVVDKNTLQMIVKKPHLKSINTGIYSFLRQSFNLDEGFKEPIKKHKDTYISGGFVDRELSRHLKPGKFEKREWKMTPFQKKTFEENLKILESLQIDYILIQAPYTKQYYDSFTNQEEVKEYFQKYWNYADFNYGLKLNDRDHFYDDDHLNSEGVSIFNEEVIKQIKHLYPNL